MVDKLRGFLAEKNVTQGSLAERIGMTEGTMSRKMSGKTEFTWSEVVRIIKALNLVDDQDELRRIFFAFEDYECNRKEQTS